MNTPRVDLVQLMMSDIDEYTKKLRRFLIENDVDASSMNLTQLIESITKLKTKLKTKEYVSLTFDNNGYVVGIGYMDDFVDKDIVPNDITYGYYKFEDNNFVLDEERQRQIEEV